MWILAVIFPSIAVLLCGRPIMALVLFVAQCTFIGWLPAAIVAVMIVSEKKADKRMDRLGNKIRASMQQPPQRGRSRQGAKSPDWMDDLQ